MLRATCYLSTLDDILAVRRRLAAEFPQAALNFVQRQRASAHSAVECEAVARLRAAPAEPLRFLNLPDLPLAPAHSQVALVSAPRLAITGTQLAFGYTDSDARLAFQRLGKALEQVGASLQNVAVSNLYPLSEPIAALAARVQADFLGRAHLPAGSMLPFQGLPSLDAAFAVEVVAVLPR